MSKRVVAIVLLTRREVETLDTSHWVRAMRMPVDGLVAFGGYDSDPREVWQIPEVLAWCRAAFDRHPDAVRRMAVGGKMLVGRASVLAMALGRSMRIHLREWFTREECDSLGMALYWDAKAIGYIEHGKINGVDMVTFDVKYVQQ